MKKLSLLLMLFMVLFVLISCDDKTPEESEIESVSILFTGWVNTPTGENDPYRKWVKENYGLDVQLMATNDFAGDVVIKFASNKKPDIVVFDTMQSYQSMLAQGVLVDDWTPYLESMPNMVRTIKNGSVNGEATVAEKIFTNDGKLQALWTTPDPATWSLKIREDWAEEYRSYLGTDWQPKTPEDLLNFARWIKVNKPGCYGFTSAGSRTSFGTLGHYVSYMYGYVNELPYSLYLDENGNVQCGVTNGSYKKVLDYIKTIVSEGLIDPQWYDQTWEQKTKTKQGKIGIEWYPGTITEETEGYNKDKLAEGETTINWWKTYSLPSDGGKYSGYMPIDSYFGKIITVSKKCALNKGKMEKICSLLNDICFYYDETAEGTAKFARGKAYDALRWGIGIETGLDFQTINDTAYSYICTYSSDSHYYRESGEGQGAWDWGAWFSTTGDGVIQGSGPTVGDIALKVYEHNAVTANMATQVQIGASLYLDATLINDITAKTNNYAYKYVTGQSTGYDSYEEFVNTWLKSWHGQQILDEAKVQFEELGFIK